MFRFHWDFSDYTLLLQVTNPPEKLHIYLTNESSLHVRSFWMLFIVIGRHYWLQAISFQLAYLHNE